MPNVFKSVGTFATTVAVCIASPMVETNFLHTDSYNANVSNYNSSSIRIVENKKEKPIITVYKDNVLSRVAPTSGSTFKLSEVQVSEWSITKIKEPLIKVDDLVFDFDNAFESNSEEYGMTIFEPSELVLLTEPISEVNNIDFDFDNAFESNSEEYGMTIFNNDSKVSLL